MICTSRFAILAASITCIGFAINCTNPINDPRPLEQVLIAKSAIIATTTSSDYGEGNVDILCLGDVNASQNLLPIHGDNLVRTYGNVVYILELFGKDNVIRAHRTASSHLAFDYQTNIGKSVNIQDIACAGDKKAYITQYQSRYCVVFDPERGKSTGEIDLGGVVAYAGTDSAEQVPYMSKAIVVGNKCYIACQQLKVKGTYPMPADSSCIAVISVESDSVTGKIVLNKKNPISIDTAGGKLYVSCVGAYFDATDGGIECIDLASGINEGTILTEQQFGGDISAIAMVNQQKGYVSVQKGAYPDYWSQILPFNPMQKQVGNPVADIDNAFGGMAFSGSALYVGDRSEKRPGIVTVDPATDTKTAGPIKLGMPPNSLAILKVQ